MHKSHPDYTVNIINYMSQFTDEFKFLGFIELDESFNHWGTTINGVPVVAVHVSLTPMSRLRSDDPLEQQDLDSGKLWVLVLYGSDNTSYLKRFLSKDQAVKWFHKTTKVVHDNRLRWYNS